MSTLLRAVMLPGGTPFGDAMSSCIPDTLHSHQCRHCGHIWEHLTLRVAAGVKASQDPAYIEAHRCPCCRAAPTFPFPILSGWRP